MKYAFPIFQYCRRTIYLLTNARHVMWIMKKSAIKHSERLQIFSFIYKLIWKRKQVNYVSLKKRTILWLWQHISFNIYILTYSKIFFSLGFLLRIDPYVDGYNIYSNICIIDINQKFPSITQRRDPPCIRIKKDFVTMTHFSLRSW